MNEIVRAAWVIARRDYVATVWSKTFLLFLIGPLFPIIFGFVFGAIGANIDREAIRPSVAVIAGEAEGRAIMDARERLTGRLGQGALPDLRIVAPDPAAPDQAAALLAGERVVAVLAGGTEQPVLTGPQSEIDALDGRIALILDNARDWSKAGDAMPPPVQIAREVTQKAAGTDTNGRMLTARGAQLVLVMLTMILAGMLLSNLIEEKSNKVIEVLAAAVPVDAIFLGKLVAMLAMSLTGIAVWGATGLLGVLLLVPGAAAGALPAPAVGWPVFALIGMAYFTASYLLLGAVFLGIGAQAATVREVQTLSMPVTMGQLVVFAFASSAVGDPGRPVALAASIFPWSSPFAMLARAAQAPELWPHLIALVWQASWIALIIRFAARRFRVGVLKSGRKRKGFFARRAAAGENRTAPS